jgi:hypothetical protein
MYYITFDDSYIQLKDNKDLEFYNLIDKDINDEQLYDIKEYLANKIIKNDENIMLIETDKLFDIKTIYMQIEYEVTKRTT